MGPAGSSTPPNPAAPPAAATTPRAGPRLRRPRPRRPRRGGAGADASAGLRGGRGWRALGLGESPLILREPLFRETRRSRDGQWAQGCVLRPNKGTNRTDFCGFEPQGTFLVLVHVSICRACAILGLPVL